MDKKITASEFAKLLDGREYGEEITEDEEVLALSNKLVVVFGASDDLIEFRGAFYNEFEADNGAVFFFDNKLRFIVSDEIINKDLYYDLNLDTNDLSNRAIVRFNFRKLLNNKITQEWKPENSIAKWKISANFPNETFNIMRNDNLYCIGIVFNLDSLE